MWYFKERRNVCHLMSSKIPKKDTHKPRGWPDKRRSALAKKRRVFRVGKGRISLVERRLAELKWDLSARRQFKKAGYKRAGNFDDVQRDIEDCETWLFLYRDKRTLSDFARNEAKRQAKSYAKVRNSLKMKARNACKRVEADLPGSPHYKRKPRSLPSFEDFLTARS